MDRQADFPAPDVDALAHSRKLTDLIRDRVASAGGWIDFSDYMDLVLYAPGLGYYSAGARKFGADGDFVTAPEISPLFSRTIARALIPVLRGFERATILEIGAGTGAMAAECLATLNEEGVLPERYLILEVSADLRQRQDQTLRERVPALMDRVEWLDDFPKSPIDGVIVANEVLDALPVTCFTVTESGLCARGVGVEGDTFAWVDVPASGKLREAVCEIESNLPAPFPEGYTSELCPSLPAFVAGLGASLNRGRVLLIDYGLPCRDYYHPDRSTGTLRCHYRHRAHSDPFLYPGLQDVTAWVDFTAVAAGATAAGLEVAGYTTQAQFLLGSGVDRELATLLESNSASSDALSRFDLAGQLKKLVMPGEMGERFKVIALDRKLDGGAFPGRDLRHLL